MTAVPRQRSAGAELIDIKTQPAATRNAIFPFSSPNIDEEMSPVSEQSRYYSRARNSVECNHPTRSTGLMVDTTSQKEAAVADALDKRNGSNRKQDGLRLITTFSPVQLRSENIAVNQVVAKQPKQAKSRVLSVASQKGINESASPPSPSVSAEALSHLRQLIITKWDQKLMTRNKLDRFKRSRIRRDGQSPTRSSVVFGLRLPEREAAAHQDSDALESAVTLVTPVTPRIVIAPAGSGPGLLASQSPYHPAADRAQTSSSTSLPSEPACQHIHPQANLTFSMSQPDCDCFETDDGQSKQWPCPEDMQQILARSCSTNRPISQGWWNLILSPILSRAGTLKRPGAADSKIPAVPPLPDSGERNFSPRSPLTMMSPETPRRQGLAGLSASMLSRRTEWETEKEIGEQFRPSSDQALPTLPRDMLLSELNIQAPLAASANYEYRGEGSAAEYYHACAIEQLANITYFECVNHSCADQLPKLKSIHDVGRRASKANTLPDHTNGQVSSKAVQEDGSATRDNSGRTNTDPLHIIGDFSETTEIVHRCGSPDSAVDSDLDLAGLASPNLRQAQTAAVSKAKTVESRQTSPPLPLETQLKPVHPKIQPPSTSSQQQTVTSPGPLTPEAAHMMAPAGAVSMAPIRSLPAECTVPLVAPVPYSNHALVPPFQPVAPLVYNQYLPSGSSQIVVSPQQICAPSDPSQVASHIDAPPFYMTGLASSRPASLEHAADPGTISEPAPVTSNQIHYKRDRLDDAEMGEKSSLNIAQSKQKKSIWSFLSGRGKEEKENPRRWTIAVAVLLIAIVILCILFAIFFTRGNGSANPIQTQWLNLSGYPPVPTGISTIASPNLVSSQDQCTSPSTLWSCSLSKEDQASVSYNHSDQPNFKFQIKFRNGTVPANMTRPLRRRFGDSDGDLFTPNPSPPGQQDQVFLGNTTDNVAKPFDGEPTPFYITFMNTTPVQSLSANSRRLLVRQSDDNDLLNSVPPPSLGPDGTAAAASLLPTTPFPISQPLKLYNRGLRDEHYGFYMYFDKSIFLSGIILNNATATQDSQQPASQDQDGGSSKQAANVRCTWSQTRFVVKMYTNPGFGARLLPPQLNNTRGLPQQSNSTSSTTNFERPGSFAYPTTILLDRHGGDVNRKLIYCYGMNNGNIVNSEKTLVAELRSFGGVAVNPSPQLLNLGNSTFDPDLGSIDGGTGGCGCTWQNWS